MKIDRTQYPALSAEDMQFEYFPPSPDQDPVLHAEIYLWRFVPPEARKLNAEYREALLLANALDQAIKELGVK